MKENLIRKARERGRVIDRHVSCSPDRLICPFVSVSLSDNFAKAVLIEICAVTLETVFSGVRLALFSLQFENVRKRIDLGQSL